MASKDAVSEKRIIHVHPDLARVYDEANSRSANLIRVTCGIRTASEQKILFDTGKSRTLWSRHLRQPGGFSHACDLVMMKNGEPLWDIDSAFEIAGLMRDAAILIDVPVVWGGIWPTELRRISGGLTAAYENYKRGFRNIHGRAPFFDGPHFQLGV